MNRLTTSKRDRTNDNFVRTTSRFMKRCDQMSRRYNADVYLLVRRKQRHFDYKSTDDPSFPPSSGDLVSVVLFRPGNTIYSWNQKEKLYPGARQTALDYGNEVQDTWKLLIKVKSKPAKLFYRYGCGRRFRK
jgi:hypothetical protein